MSLLSGLLGWLADHPYVLVAGFVAYVLLFLFSIWFSGPGKGKNPFKSDTKRPVQPLVHDQTVRDRVLKQAFAVKRLPEKVDAIVIGSGVGGLTTATILAKTGKRVLVLEQHDQAGGCCHTFIEKGFEFDVGIHYIGKMEPGSNDRFLVDQLTDGQLDWERLEEDYDRVTIEGKEYIQTAGKKQWRDKMVEYFPEEAPAIDRLLEIMTEIRSSMLAWLLLKYLPRWVCKLLVSTGIIYLVTNYFKWANKNLKQVMDELTKNKELKAVLSYCWGDYGTMPSETSFIMQSLLLGHFQRGGWYPRGGASEIAFHMIPIIEKAGGKVLVRANVSKILVNENGRAVGVEVAKSSGDIVIQANMVISAAGVINTYKKLLPKNVAEKSALYKYLDSGKLRSGQGAFNIFIGLDGTGKELGLKAQNTWNFTSYDLDGLARDMIKRPVEDAAEEDIPLMFISFPSTKDSTWEERHPGKTTCAIVTLTPYEWFESWKDERIMKRGEDYEALKMSIAERMWQQVLVLYPQLEGKREYISVGTPLSNQYYIGAPRGEIYGLDHNLARFADPRIVMELRPKTEIPGLYLSGQDVFSCGFSGALQGGFLTAAVILNRNLLTDVKTCQNQSKASKKTQ